MNSTKSKFINSQTEKNKILHEYSRQLKSSVVDSIEINTEGVIVKFTSNGLRMFLREGDKRVATAEALNFGSYENKELSLLKRLLKNQVKTIFDVGANCGWFSLEMALSFPNAYIYAFEPIQDLFLDFQKNISLNTTTNIEAIQLGLSDKEDTIDLYFDPQNSAYTSMKNILEVDPSNAKKTSVNITTLDIFNKNPDFIKIDVEGAELLVLQGGINTIKQSKPILFIEMVRKWTKHFNYHPNDIINFLNDLGYSCYRIEDIDQILECEFMNENDLETNFIFLDRIKHANLISEFTK